MNKCSYQKQKILCLADEILAAFVQEGGRYLIEERSNQRAAASFEKGGNQLFGELKEEEARQLGLFAKKSNPFTEGFLPRQIIWAWMVIDSVRVIAPGLASSIHTKKTNSFPGEKHSGELGFHKKESPENCMDNPKIVPLGKHKGRLWSELGEEILKAALVCQHPAFSNAHREEARQALLSRESVQNMSLNSKGA